MYRDDLLGESFQVNVTLPFCFLFAGLSRDYLIFSRFIRICIIKDVCFVKKGQLPVNGLHYFRAALETMLLCNMMLGIKLG